MKKFFNSMNKDKKMKRAIEKSYSRMKRYNFYMLDDFDRQRLFEQTAITKPSKQVDTPSKAKSIL